MRKVGVKRALAKAYFEIGKPLKNVIIVTFVTEFTSSAGDWRGGDPGVGEWKPEEKVICINERFLWQ